MPPQTSPIFDGPEPRAALTDRRTVELDTTVRPSLRRRAQLAEKALEDAALERLQRDLAAAAPKGVRRGRRAAAPPGGRPRSGRRR
jgi:hypothetical protein